MNFLADPLDIRSTLMFVDDIVYEWVGGKHACVDLIGVSPLVRLGIGALTVGQAALKGASSKVYKHEKAFSHNQHVLYHLLLTLLASQHHRLLTFYIGFKG